VQWGAGCWVWGENTEQRKPTKQHHSSPWFNFDCFSYFFCNKVRKIARKAFLFDVDSFSIWQTASHSLAAVLLRLIFEHPLSMRQVARLFSWASVWLHGDFKTESSRLVSSLDKSKSSVKHLSFSINNIRLIYFSILFK